MCEKAQTLQAYRDQHVIVKTIQPLTQSKRKVRGNTAKGTVKQQTLIERKRLV